MNIRILNLVFLFMCYSASAQELTATNCTDSICKHNIDIKESGFYIFSNTLEAGSEAGLWDISLESKSESLYDTALYFGSKVTPDEKTTAFTSFFLSEESTLDLRAVDYTDSIEQFRVKVFRQIDANDSKGLGTLSVRSLLASSILEAGETDVLGTFSVGHYLMNITAYNTDNVGKLGARLNGLNLANKVTLGGQLENAESSTSFDGYMARKLSPGSYVLKSRFGASKNVTICAEDIICNGADKPEFFVKRTTPNSTRSIIASSRSLSKINELALFEGFNVTHMEASDFNTVIVYGLRNQSTGEVKVILYDRATQTYDELLQLVPSNNDNSHSITSLTVSADSSVIAFATSSVFFYEEFVPIVDAKLSIYDRADQSTNVIDTGSGCGSNCSESDGPIESMSFDATGRYLVYEPYFNFVQIYDRSEGQIESIEDLDFSFVQSLLLSNDATYLVFSSSNSSFTGDNETVQRGVFIKDLSGNGEIEMISVSADGNPMPGFNHMPVMGANDDYILFNSNIGPVVALYKYDFNKGYAEKVTDIGVDSEYSIDQSGQQIFFTSLLDFDVPKLDDTYRLWSFNNGVLKLKASSDRKSLQLPHISADGRNLLFLESGSEENQNFADPSKIYFLQQNLQHQGSLFNIRVD